METISIRNLRGKSLREKAQSGKLLAITNRGALIGVVVPVAAAWLEHLIDYNLSQVQQSIDDAERAMAAGTPMITIGDAIGQLQGLLNPGAENGEPTPSSACTVRIGDLTAKSIERAGEDGNTLAVTHDRELIAIVIPVTRNLVEFLLEQNMSRVLYNLGLADREIGATRSLSSLGLLTDSPEPGASAPVLSRDVASEPS